MGKQPIALVTESAVTVADIGVFIRGGAGLRFSTTDLTSLRAGQGVRIGQAEECKALTAARRASRESVSRLEQALHRCRNSSQRARDVHHVRGVNYVDLDR